MSARLPGNDINALTNREREVLDLLGERLTNEQIANRLGISLDGAKYHVSQILSKLGVSSREEAVIAAYDESPSRGRWFAVPVAAKLIGVSLIAATAIGLGTLAVGVLGTGDSGSSSTNDGAPRIGEDHWHVPYTVNIGDEAQPVILPFDAGIHTHGDGLIHIHPKQPDEEGANASIARFFENAGGELTDTSIRMPDSQTTFANGDPVPGDGRPGQVFIAANRGADVCGESTLTIEGGLVTASYVPQDGDVIRIWFVPEETGPQPTCISVEADP